MRRSVEFLAICGALSVTVLAGPLPGAEKKPAREKAAEPAKKASGDSDLIGWGPIKGVKDTEFWQLSYLKGEAPRKKKETAFFKVQDGAAFYADRPVTLPELKEGESIWILGRAIEREAPTSDGYVAPDRQIQNVLAIAAGEGIEANPAFRDPRDEKTKWLQVEVAKAGASILATYDGQEYKVVMGRPAPMLRREKLPEPKPLKAGMSVAVSGAPADERPVTKVAADAKKESFAVRSVTILDTRRLQSLYVLLLP